MKVPVNKAFAVPALLVLAAAVWLSSEIANIYYLFGQTPVIGGYAAEFGFTMDYMSNLPVITLGLGGLLLVALFTIGPGAGRGETTV